MLLIVMKTCHTPEGWNRNVYKLFKSCNYSESESDSDSESDSESENDKKNNCVKGYKHEKYRKILLEEDLLPE